MKNSWLPGFIGFIGILLVMSAIIGFYAASKLKGSVLFCNGCWLAVIAVLLLGFGIFCLADRCGPRGVPAGRCRSLPAAAGCCWLLLAVAGCCYAPTYAHPATLTRHALASRRAHPPVRRALAVRTRRSW